MYAYLSKESPEFPGLVCLNKHQHDFCFCTELWFPKNPCENMGSCLVLGKREKQTKEFLMQWFCKYKSVLSMLFAWTHHKHKKNTWFYLQERLIWQRKSCGILSQITDKNLNRLKKIKKFLQAWSSRGSLGQELARHSAVQFPFGLCWGFWPCLPPSFFGLSHCWRLNKNSRPVGRTFTRGIFKCLLE